MRIFSAMIHVFELPPLEWQSDEKAQSLILPNQAMVSTIGSVMKDRASI